MTTHAIVQLAHHLECIEDLNISYLRAVYPKAVFEVISRCKTLLRFNARYALVSVGVVIWIMCCIHFIILVILEKMSS